MTASAAPNSRSRLWLPALLCAALSTVPAARAQPDTPRCAAGVPENTVAAWLHSGEPRLVAWGACNVRLQQDTALLPDLVALARQWQPLPVQPPASDATALRIQPTEADFARRDAMSAVLAAIIGMGATVPADALRTLAADLPAPVAVLAASMPQDEVQPLLMEWFTAPDKPETPWHLTQLRRVAASLLARRPPPGFAAVLLRATTVRLELQVYTPGNAVGWGMSSHCGAGMGALAPRKGWPESIQYSLHEWLPGSASSILVSGNAPVALDSIRSTRYAGTLSLYLDDRRRMLLVAQMLALDPRAVPAWQAGPTQIPFTSDAQYADTAAHLVASTQHRLVQTADLLVQAGVLRADEVDAALPQLQLHIWDQRHTPGSGPLPPVPLPPSANVRLADANSIGEVWNAWTSTADERLP